MQNFNARAFSQIGVITKQRVHVFSQIECERQQPARAFSPLISLKPANIADSHLTRHANRRNPADPTDSDCV